MAARRISITAPAAGTVRLENGVVIREDTSATGSTYYLPIGLVSRVSWNKTGNTVDVRAPGNALLAGMAMSASDAETFTNALLGAAGFAGNAVMLTFE